MSVNGDLMRRLALGGVLQTHRTAKGWSVEQAAVHAGIGHMTWGRVQDGYGVRNRTYGAIDALLELRPGTVKRALGDDLVMVTLIRDVAGVDTKDVTTGSAAAFVERFAKSTLSDSAKPTVGARATVTLHPARSEKPSPPAGTPIETMSDWKVAAELMERFARRHHTPEIMAAARAVMDAMPALFPSIWRDNGDGGAASDGDDRRGVS